MKRLLALLLLVLCLPGCTDYAAQLEDEYGEMVDAQVSSCSGQSNPVYLSSSSTTYYTPTSSSSVTNYTKPKSSSSVASVAVCGSNTYNPKKEFCNDNVVDTFCNTSCWSADESQCSSCLNGVSCNGFPYNPKKFACVSGELHQLCDASYFGHWFEALWNSCI